MLGLEFYVFLLLKNYKKNKFLKQIFDYHYIFINNLQNIKKMGFN